MALHGRCPGGVCQGRLRRAKKVEKTDDADQSGVLEQSDEGVDDSRDDMRQRLRQHDQSHLLPVGQPDGVGALILPLVDGLEAAAHHFGHIGGREQHHADQGTQKIVEIDTFGKEQRQHDRGHEKHRDQRHAAPEFDEYNRQDPRDRHVRTPPERQHNAERKRRDDTGDGHDKRNQQAAPVIRVDGLEPDIGAQNQHDAGIDHQQPADDAEHPGEGGH